MAVRPGEPTKPPPCRCPVAVCVWTLTDAGFGGVSALAPAVGYERPLTRHQAKQRPHSRQRCSCQDPHQNSPMSPLCKKARYACATARAGKQPAGALGVRQGLLAGRLQRRADTPLCKGRHIAFRLKQLHLTANKHLADGHILGRGVGVQLLVPLLQEVFLDTLLGRSRSSEGQGKAQQHGSKGGPKPKKGPVLSALRSDSHTAGFQERPRSWTSSEPSLQPTPADSSQHQEPECRHAAQPNHNAPGGAPRGCRWSA